AVSTGPLAFQSRGGGQADPPPQSVETTRGAHAVAQPAQKKESGQEEGLPEHGGRGLREVQGVVEGIVREGGKLALLLEGDVVVPVDGLTEYGLEEGSAWKRGAPPTEIVGKVVVIVRQVREGRAVARSVGVVRPQQDASERKAKLPTPAVADDGFAWG